jgi:hypothetical protein
MSEPSLLLASQLIFHAGPVSRLCHISRESDIIYPDNNLLVRHTSSALASNTAHHGHLPTSAVMVNQFAGARWIGSLTASDLDAP